MLTFIAQLVQHLLATALLAGTIFLLLLLLLQRGRLGSTLSAVWNVLRSVVLAPLQYVRLVLDRITDSGGAPPVLRGERQFLTGRLLVAAELCAVLCAVLLVASGIARGWFGMVPARDDVAQYRAALATQESLQVAIPQHQAAVARLDSVWRADSSRLVNSYTRQLRSTISEKDSRRQEVRRAIAARPAVARQQVLELLNEIETAPWQLADEWAARYEGRVRDLEASLQGVDAATRTQLGFRREDSALFASYLSDWRESRNATGLIERWPPPVARDVVQSEYKLQETGLALAQQTLQGVQSALPSLEDRANWKQLEFVKRVGVGLLSAFLFVWGIGVLIEMLGLGVDIADNLRRIRLRLDEDTRKQVEFDAAKL